MYLQHEDFNEVFPGVYDGRNIFVVFNEMSVAAYGPEDFGRYLQDHIEDPRGMRNLISVKHAGDNELHPIRFVWQRPVPPPGEQMSLEVITTMTNLIVWSGKLTVPTP